MKRNIIIGGMLVFTSLFFVSRSDVSAEESSHSQEAVITESSVLENQELSTTDTAELTEETGTVDSEVEEEETGLRESLIYWGRVPKEIIDRLTEEQIQEISRIAQSFGSQTVTLLEDLLVKIYGSNPIPEESYLTEYSQMTPDELKKYLPQIRLSLIHVFDVDEQKVSAVSDAQLISWIDEIVKKEIPSNYWVASLGEKISGRDVFWSESSSTETTGSSSNSSESEEESDSKQKDMDDKKGLPNTGETVWNPSIIVGVMLAVAAGLILLKRRKKVV